MLQECPIITELELPKTIGPKIKLVHTAGPRVNPILKSSSSKLLEEDGDGYATVGPPTRGQGGAGGGAKPGSGWQDNIDSGYVPSSSSTSATSESPVFGHSPRQPGPKHFVFSTASPPLEDSHSHTYTLPPDCIESVYITTSELDSTEQLDHTFVDTFDHPYTLPDDPTALEEVKDEEDFETTFDGKAVSVAASDTQSTSTVNSQDHPVAVEHIRTEKGALYAVVNKETPRHTAGGGKSGEVRHSHVPTNPKPNATVTGHRVSTEGGPADSSMVPLPNLKVEQMAELKQLPSIAQKRLELERRMQGDEDEKSSDESPSPPPQRLSRVSIPEALQTKPLPPPMSTHPGLLKKAEEQQRQLELSEKKRRSFKFKKRDSKERLREMEKALEEPEDPPVMPVRRMSGATPISPMVGDTHENELKSKFKDITKQQWNTSIFEIPPPLPPRTTHTTTTFAPVIRSPEPTVTTFQVGLPVAATNGVASPAPAVATSSTAQTGAVQARDVTTHTSTTPQTNTTQAVTTFTAASQPSLPTHIDTTAATQTDVAPSASVTQTMMIQPQTMATQASANMDSPVQTNLKQPQTQQLATTVAEHPSQKTISAPQRPQSRNLEDIVPGVQLSVLQASSSSRGKSGAQRSPALRKQVSEPVPMVTPVQQRTISEEPITMGPMNFKRISSRRKRKIKKKKV